MGAVASGGEVGTGERAMRTGGALGLVSAMTVALALAGCANERTSRSSWDSGNYGAPVEPPPAVPPPPEGPAVPRIEVKLANADPTLVRGRLATSRRARSYTITVDQASHLVAEKPLTSEEALKRTNGASSDAAFRLDYVFNSSGGVVTVSLEASIVANPGRPGELVQPITMPAGDADALKREIQDAA